MQPPGKGEKKVYIFGPGHLISIMPICSKNMKKSSPEPLGWLPYNFVCGIWRVGPLKLIEMMTMG